MFIIEKRRLFRLESDGETRPVENNDKELNENDDDDYDDDDDEDDEGEEDEQ